MRCLRLCLIWVFATPVWFAVPVWAVECQDLQFQGTWYSVCKIGTRRDDMRLFLHSADGLLYGDFARLNAQGQALDFAMNAGMYHSDR
jgi:uncharacterized protein YigE (DUF2233 family)